MHLFFMTCITGFTFFSIIVSHNYMKFEIPVTKVNHQLDASSYEAARADPVADLGYCGTVGGNEYVDFVTLDGQTFADPQCVSSLDANEFTVVDANHLWVNTHFTQRTVYRACPGADGTAFVDCVETTNNTIDGFIVRPELTQLSLTFNVETSFGMSQAPDELNVRFPSGRLIQLNPSKNPGQPLQLTVAEVLELAGLELNETSASAMGTAAVYNAVRAPHRLMGLKLRVSVSSSNVNPDPWKPFDTTLRTEVTVKHTPTTGRVGPNDQVIYLGGETPVGSSLQAHSQTRVERDWAGIYIEYQSDGNVGDVNLIQTITAITNAFVLIGMATFIVDFIGQLISTSFYDDKYEDDGERLILENIAEHLEDPSHPDVPFDPKHLRLVNDEDQPGLSYENAIYNLQAEVADMREQLSLIPEEEAEFVDGSAPGRQQDGWPRLMLVDEFTAQFEIEYMEANDGEKPVPLEVPLHPGVQMMGRGVGAVHSKAVSRQQFTLTVVKDKVRMKALRDGPGYMREDSRDGSGRFEALKATKAVVLNVGDRVCFRLREGKMGGHLGVYRIETEEPPVKSFFSILLGC